MAVQLSHDADPAQREDEMAAAEISSEGNDLIELSDADRQVATALGIHAEINAKDFIYQFQLKRMGNDQAKSVPQYYRVGRYSADLLKNEFLPEIRRIRSRLGNQGAPATLLDFASGYGAVARHFGQVLPELEVTTCDIHQEATRFNSSVLGLRTIQSTLDPDDLRLPEQDIIIALSFFSHMPEVTFRHWLSVLSRALAPCGALVFTTRGFITHSISPNGVIVGNDGFGFRPSAEQLDLDGTQYGLTVSLPTYVDAAVRACDGIRISVFREGLWWNHQDVYVCMKA
jgi:hypothetical protein